jgi:hypothetical protein
MASLNTSVENLDAAWKALLGRWDATKAVWNDPVQRDFEEQYWQPLEQHVHATQQEMARLAEVIAKARQSVK